MDRPNIDSREAFTAEEELAYQAYLDNGGDEVTDDDYEEMCDYFDSLDERARDEMLAQQELEDFERTDEYYGYYGDDCYDSYDEY